MSDASIAPPAPATIRREDYRPPEFAMPAIELEFSLDPAATVVTARQRYERRTQGDLVLYGEDQELLSVRLDGVELPAARYAIDGSRMVLRDLPDAFTLEMTSRIDPAANTSLMGLYLSNGVFCTQCEPEGFRRIVWSPDRPDVMSTYRVRIEADAAAFPILLSNGNRLAGGELPGRRHWGAWAIAVAIPA